MAISMDVVTGFLRKKFTMWLYPIVFSMISPEIGVAGLVTANSGFFEVPVTQRLHKHFKGLTQGDFAPLSVVDRKRLASGWP